MTKFLDTGMRLQRERSIDKKAKVAPAVEKKIHHALEKEGGSASFSALGARLGSDDMTLRRYLAVLLKRGSIQFDGVTGKWSKKEIDDAG